MCLFGFVETTEVKELKWTYCSTCKLYTKSLPKNDIPSTVRSFYILSSLSPRNIWLNAWILNLLNIKLFLFPHWWAMSEFSNICPIRSRCQFQGCCRLDVCSFLCNTGLRAPGSALLPAPSLFCVLRWSISVFIPVWKEVLGDWCCPFFIGNKCMHSLSSLWPVEPHSGLVPFCAK